MADNGNTESLIQELGQGGALVSRLDWIEAEEDLLSNQWELHSRYLDSLDPYLANTLRDWEQAIEQQAQQIDNAGQRSEFYDFHSDEYLEHLSFRSILMNSFFLASLAIRFIVEDDCMVSRTVIAPDVVNISCSSTWK